MEERINYREEVFELDLTLGGLASYTKTVRFDKIVCYSVPSGYVYGDITLLNNRIIPNIPLYTGKEINIPGKQIVFRFGWAGSVGCGGTFPSGKFSVMFVVGDDTPEQHFATPWEEIYVGENIACGVAQANLLGRVITVYPPRGLCLKCDAAPNVADYIYLVRGSAANPFPAPRYYIVNAHPVPATSMYLPFQFQISDPTPVNTQHFINYPPGAWEVYLFTTAAITVTKCTMICSEEGA